MLYFVLTVHSVIVLVAGPLNMPISHCVKIGKQSMIAQDNWFIANPEWRNIMPRAKGYCVKRGMRPQERRLFIGPETDVEKNP